MGDEMDRDPPIAPMDWTYGVKVIDFGDLRVARGLSRRPYSGCPHKQLVYDKQERRIWCQDCEKNIEAFDAFEGLVAQYAKAYDALTARIERLAEVEQFQARSLAAKRIDDEWRRRNTVPACPHCGQGLFPEDFKNGCGTLGREYAEARAKKRKRP